MNINFLLILLIIILILEHYGLSDLLIKKISENFAELQNKPPESTLVQTCPDNYTLKDGLCYLDSEFICSEDSIYIDGGCYSPDFIDSNNCPEYYRLIDNKCYKYSGIPSISDSDGIIPTTTYTCPDGLNSVNGFCLPPNFTNF
jgi:hypothetical protein